MRAKPNAKSAKSPAPPASWQTVFCRLQHRSLDILRLVHALQGLDEHFWEMDGDTIGLTLPFARLGFLALLGLRRHGPRFSDLPPNTRLSGLPDNAPSQNRTDTPQPFAPAG